MALITWYLSHFKSAPLRRLSISAPLPHFGILLPRDQHFDSAKPSKSTFIITYSSLLTHSFIFLTSLLSLRSLPFQLSGPHFFFPNRNMDPTKIVSNGSFTRLTGRDNWAQWKSDVQIVQKALAGFEESRTISNLESTLPAALTAKLMSQPRCRHQTSTHDNWLNQQNISGACDRCSHSGHNAAACFRDMPEAVKEQL